MSNYKLNSLRRILNAREDPSLLDHDSSAFPTRAGEFLTCDHCFRMFQNLSSLKSHIYTHVDVEVFDCLECNASLLSKNALRRHIDTHDRSKTHECVFCHTKVTRKENLKRHFRRCKLKPPEVPLRGPHDLDNVADNHKGKVTVLDERLTDTDRQRKAGNKLTRFPCNQCDLKFRWKSRLKRHVERVHQKKKKLLCHICGKLFSSSKFSEHISYKHTGNPRVVCEVCGKTFTHASLPGHKLMHSGKPYHCTICGKLFSQKVSLTVHRRTHTGERPFECKTCGKTFKVKHGLHQHQISHTGPRETFECKVCNKSFRHSGNLYTHMAIHKAIKPHHCDLCGMSFRLPHHLRNHLKTHEGKRRR